MMQTTRPKVFDKGYLAGLKKKRTKKRGQRELESHNDYVFGEESFSSMTDTCSPEQFSAEKIAVVFAIKYYHTQIIMNLKLSFDICKVNSQTRSQIRSVPMLVIYPPPTL